MTPRLEKDMRYIIGNEDVTSIMSVIGSTFDMSASETQLKYPLVFTCTSLSWWSSGVSVEARGKESKRAREGERVAREERQRRAQTHHPAAPVVTQVARRYLRYSTVLNCRRWRNIPLLLGAQASAVHQRRVLLTPVRVELRPDHGTVDVDVRHA